MKTQELKCEDFAQEIDKALQNKHITKHKATRLHECITRIKDGSKESLLHVAWQLLLENINNTTEDDSGSVTEAATKVQKTHHRASPNQTHRAFQLDKNGKEAIEWVWEDGLVDWLAHKLQEDEVVFNTDDYEPSDNIESVTWNIQLLAQDIPEQLQPKEQNPHPFHMIPQGQHPWAGLVAPQVLERLTT